MRVFHCGAALGLAGVLAASATAQINYGDFSGNTVDFLSVTEDSGTDPAPPPLFGAPMVSGDSLDFDPLSFLSNAQGGTLDSTIGTLALAIEAKPSFAIDALEFHEAGDYTMFGMGGADTSATISTPVFIDITQVDGVDISPISVNANMVYTPSAGDYNLADDGPGFGVIWTGALDVNLNQTLADEGVVFATGATKVEVILNNILGTTTEAGSPALIQKKDFRISVVPEPNSLALLALAGLFVRRR